MSGSNISQSNPYSGNSTNDSVIARTRIKSKGTLEVHGTSDLKKGVITPCITHRNGTNINGVSLKDGCLTASKVTIGDETIKLPTVTYLTNEDFVDGTYRIRNAGKYVLCEDIVFNPDPGSTRIDRPPGIDWFSAISIECENFELDGAGYSLSVGLDFLDAHIQKVFSLIELSNAPFPGIPFPLTTVTYVGDTEFLWASRGKIHNIKLGLSSHHGIHGNGNTDIVIENFVISDHEVAGITLNSCYNITIRNGTINGNRHEIVNRSRPAQLKTLLESLRIYESETGSGDHISAIESALADELLARSQDPITVPDGNTYGIAISPSPAAGGPRFNAAERALVPDLGFQKFPSNVVIENVRINDIRGAPNQQICLVGNIAVSPYGGSPDTPKLQQIVTNHAGAFGALQWHDFYVDGTGAWNVTPVAKAQTWLLQQRCIELGHDDSVSYFLPTGFEANILDVSPDEATFRGHVQPGFEFDIAHFNKGVIGIKLGCANGVKITNCCITRVYNSSPASLIRSQIAAGGFYTDSQVNLNSRITGEDAYGISLENCTNCIVKGTNAVEIKSDNGFAHGVAISGQSKGNQFIDCDLGDVVTYADPVAPTDPANPSGRSYGALVESSELNKLEATKIVAISAPRCAFGFSSNAGRGNAALKCPVSGVYATAAHDAALVKKARGFNTQDGSTTHLDQCTARDVAITGESGEVAQSTSTAAAYEINDDFNLIEACKAFQTDADAGESHGISIEGNDNITKSKVIHLTFASNANGVAADYVDAGTGNFDL